MYPHLLVFLLILCGFSRVFAETPVNQQPPSGEVSPSPRQPEIPLEPQTQLQHPLPEPYNDTYSTQTPLGDDHFYTEFFKMLFMLGLIIVLLLLASWFLKRMLSSRVQQVNCYESNKNYRKTCFDNQNDRVCDGYSWQKDRHC